MVFFVVPTRIELIKNILLIIEIIFAIYQYFRKIINLIEIIDCDETNILELTILLSANKGSLFALEALLNRSIGLPRQSEVQLKQEEYSVTMNL